MAERTGVVCSCLTCDVCLTAFLSSEYARVFRSMRRALSCREDAEDATQQAMERFWRAKAKLPPGEQPSRLLWGVVRSVKLHTHRAAGRRRRREEAAIAERAVPISSAQWATEDPHDVEALLVWLTVPEPYRDSCVRHYYEGVPVGALASEWNLTYRQVAHRLEAGRRHLRAGWVD